MPPFHSTFPAKRRHKNPYGFVLLEGVKVLVRMVWVISSIIDPLYLSRSERKFVTQILHVFKDPNYTISACNISRKQ
jgi:hypothetical protein